MPHLPSLAVIRGRYRAVLSSIRKNTGRFVDLTRTRHARFMGVATAGCASLDTQDFECARPMR